MRKFNVFGKKLSQIRPFYVLLVLFIVIIPAHFVLNYFQEAKLEKLQEEQIQLEEQIANLLEDYDYEIDHTNMGDIYSGFKHYYFDYYLEEDINLLFDLSGLTLVEPKNIYIDTNTTNPFPDNLPDDMTIKKVSLDFVLTDEALLFDFLEVIFNQNQLFYVDNINVNLLQNNDLAVEMDLYVFYLN